MCVIINLKENAVVPQHMLESACIVNPHGFGVAVADRGTLVIQRGYDPKGNDPENIARILEQSKHLPTVLHLRYQTKGEKNVENCHPFVVLNKVDHDMELMFMHNGTMYDDCLKSDKYSDSKMFAEGILTPLFERTMDYFEQRDIFNDPLTQVIMEKFAGTANKFSLMDNLGNQMIVNEDQGKLFDWGWASNDYSFNSTHRTGNTGSNRSSTTYHYGPGPRGSLPSTQQGALIQSKASTKDIPWEGGKNATASTEDTTKVDTLSDQLDTIREFMKNDQKEGRPTVVRAIEAPTKRKNFVTETGLNSLEDICAWDPDDFLELVSLYPEAATLLLMDLQYELFLNKERVGASANAA